MAKIRMAADDNYNDPQVQAMGSFKTSYEDKYFHILLTLLALGTRACFFEYAFMVVSTQ